MVNKTEQKILEVALKIFAEKGYAGATTRVIALESGFTELTLFRKFSTKKNLYNMVISQYTEKMMKDYQENVFIDKKFEDPKDFLETYVKNSLKTSWDNFEVFYLSVNENNKDLEPMMEETTKFASMYIEKNIPDKKIDYLAFGLTISSFVYVINLEKYHQRIASFGKNIEDVVDSFIENLNKLIE